MAQEALLRLSLRFGFCPARLAFFFPRERDCFGLTPEFFADFGLLSRDKASVLATTLAVLAARVPATDPATRANLIMRASGAARFLSVIVSP